MGILISGCVILVFSGAVAVLLGRSRTASWVATAGVWIGCAMALVPVVATLAGRVPRPLQIAWSMPGGSLSFGLDGLSAFFCLPILIVAPLAALYGCAYLAHEKKSLGSVLCFYNILVASMLLLTAARNGLLFLVLWEIMAISSFFLVVFDDEHAHVRQAGWTYLVATHIGTAALLVFFALLGRQANSLEFDAMTGAKLAPALANVLFVLAVIGFGSKAGFIPLHVWLPEAHPAAPSHVSALMSGVMIKTGIYGLLRALTLLGTPPAAWGWTRHRRLGFGRSWRSFRAGSTRPQAPPGLSQRGEHRHHHPGHRRRSARAELESAGAGRARLRRRHPARAEPRGVQEPAVPRRRRRRP